MNEINFNIQKSPEGGYTARAQGHSIFTEANTLSDLRANIQEAVRCHFEPGKRPHTIRSNRAAACSHEWSDAPKRRGTRGR